MNEPIELESNHTSPPLSHDDKLRALLYQFLNLHDRWSEDRLAFAKRGAELDEVIAAIDQEVGELYRMQKTLTSSVRQALSDAVDSAAVEISDALEKESKQALVRTKQGLDDTLSQLSRTTNRILSESTTTRLSWAVGAVLLSVLGAVLVTKLLLPRHLYQLSDEDIRNLGYGRDFVMMYREGTNSEKKWMKIHWETFKNKERTG